MARLSRPEVRLSLLRWLFERSQGCDFVSVQLIFFPLGEGLKGRLFGTYAIFSRGYEIFCKPFLFFARMNSGGRV